MFLSTDSFSSFMDWEYEVRSSFRSARTHPDQTNVISPKAIAAKIGKPTSLINAETNLTLFSRYPNSSFSLWCFFGAGDIIHLPE